MKVDITWGGDEYAYNLAYEGLGKMLKRWYTDTTSERIRQAAEDFITIATCPECAGTRLKLESRWFKVAEKNIAELAEMGDRNWPFFWKISRKKCPTGSGRSRGMF